MVARIYNKLNTVPEHRTVCTRVHSRTVNGAQEQPAGDEY